MMDHLPTADLSDHGPPVLASADAAAAVQHVAVLGTGIMGAGMARSLLRAGNQVSVWNRTYERAAPLGESGATVATSVAECVHDASVVITMLFDTAATLEVKPELLESMNPDSVWVQAATVGPDGARDAAHRAPRLLDAPVLGTRGPAEAGALVTLTSGPAELARKARPVVEGYSSKIVDVGRRIGQASSLKLVCNAWVDLLVAGVGQSIAMAQQLDLDPALFLHAIADGPVDAAVAQAKGAAILREATAERSFVLSGVVKDIDLMLAAINNTDVDAALIAAMRDVYQRAADIGYSDHDMAAAWRGFLP